MSFDKAIKVILRHEGGYVNHPADPGGITNLGVTKATWEGWTGKPATVADMRALTVEQVSPLYRKRYWDAMRCDDYPPAVALCVFDFGVNAGIKRGVRYLQLVVGAAQDGTPGPNTTAAVNAFVAEHGTKELVERYQERREGYYAALPTFRHFGKGWLRRVAETTAEAKEMA